MNENNQPTEDVFFSVGKLVSKLRPSTTTVNMYRYLSILVNTYIPLTLYPRRGSRGISDIPPRHPRFIKITYL
jgi:hypothetical protein